METRASHILVGGFVLTLIVGLVAFTIWIAKVDLDAEYKDYDIYFDDTVSGLYKRGTVFYLGIPVGEVRDITLAPDDPRKVRVITRLNADVPVNVGTTARLEFQGLTGVAYIELHGGAPTNPIIEIKDGEERPVIPAEASAFQEVFMQAPNLVNEAIAAVGRVSLVLSDENIASITAVLKNTDEITRNIARGTTDIDGLVADTRAALAKVTDAAEALSGLATTGNELLGAEGQRLVEETVLTMQHARSLVARLDGVVADNEETVTQFVGSTLPEISRLIMDLRRTARDLSRVVGQLENNPSEVIFGPGDKAYDLEKRQKDGDQ